MTHSSVDKESVTLNIDKLRTILYGLDSNPDIIAVTESRINDGNKERVEENSGDAELSGYRFSKLYMHHVYWY